MPQNQAHTARFRRDILSRIERLSRKEEGARCLSLAPDRKLALGKLALSSAVLLQKERLRAPSSNSSLENPGPVRGRVNRAY